MTQVLPCYGHAYSIDDVTSVVIPRHAWFYDVQVNDFLLKPIHMLEETTGPTVTARINGTVINVPASWYILIVDDETKTVDTVLITQCASSAFKAYLMHPSLNRYEAVNVELLDLSLDKAVVHLTIPRLTMICHPVGTTVTSKDLPMNVLIGPQDIGKHMVNMSAQELLI
jgi:hypothetical protein